MKKTMKKLSAFMMAMALSGALFAQVPQKFNYQGIARDAKGNPMTQKTMSLKLSVLPTADASAPEYEEVQQVTTNEFGLYTLQIGNGTALTGEMKNVKWETGNKYIRVAIDPQGGSNYSDAGTTQLLSVPYAIYADKAGTAKNSGDRTGTVTSNAAHVAGDANFLAKFTGLNVIGKSRLFDNGTTVAIGTASPNAGFNFHLRRTTSGGHFLMENPTANSFGTFRMMNDNPANFATFTKYGSAVAGGYTGIASLYPFANMLGYGNNGPFLNAGTGNIGFAITKGGTNKLKIHIDADAERLGFGGVAVPQAQTHFNNTDAGNDTVKFTNQTTGHTAADGTELRFNGNTTRLVNRENGALVFGTNNTDRMVINGAGNVGIGTASPSARLHIETTADSGIVSNTIIERDSASGNIFLTNSAGVGNMTFGAVGQVTGSDFGAGLFGRGFGFTYTPFTLRDIGVYGSANFGSSAIGVLGSSNNGTAVMGLATTGIAGYFKAPSGTALIADSGNAIVNTGRLGVGTTAPNTQVEVKSTGSLFSGDLVRINDSANNLTFPASALGVHVGDGVGLTINKTGFNEAARIRKDQTSSGVETMEIFGNLALGTPTLRVTADTNQVAAQLNGALRVVDGTQGAGKIMVSDAGGQASWSANAPGTIAQMDFASGSTLTPNATLGFLSNTTARVPVTITSNTQKVHITTTVALGANATGANGLNLYVGYNTTNVTTPVTQLGGGSFGLTCSPSQRQLYTLSATVTGLAPGTYYFGMIGNSSNVNWTNNEFGYTSVIVKN